MADLVAGPFAQASSSSSPVAVPNKVGSSAPNKRGWKFDNPCLMCKKGTSKIVGNAEVPCTCGGKPAKKRSITAEAFNPFALSSAGPSFVPPTKIEIHDPAPEPLVQLVPDAIPQFVQMQKQLPYGSERVSYQPSNQRPVSFARPIPTIQHPIIIQPPVAPLSNSVQPLMRQEPHHFSPPQSQPQTQFIPQHPLGHEQPGRMGAVLHNILDEMKQLSAITQQLKEEHNSFLSQVERLKRKNRDMQYLIEVGKLEPLAAFAQVNRGSASDLTSDDVIALLQAQAIDSTPKPPPVSMPPECDQLAPFLLNDATKPFMVLRPSNLELTTWEVSQLCDQRRMNKTAKDKLRVTRVAVSEAFCKLVNFERDDLLQSKEPRKIIRSKHKKHFFLKVAPYLLKPSTAKVSPVLPFEPRFRTKEGTILFTASKMQVFYNENGGVSFLIVSVEEVTKTHVPGYMQAQQRLQAKRFQLNINGNNMMQQQQQQQPVFKLMKLDPSFNTPLSSFQQQQQDDIFRNDEDELDAEEEAFLNGGSYPYYFPQSRSVAQPSGSYNASCFDSPVGSPISSSGILMNNNPMGVQSFSPPASPGGGGCISVGTFNEFATADASEMADDLSWLLNQNTPDTFPLAF